MHSKLLLLAFIILIPLASAITVYSGESIELQLDEQFEYFSVVGNSTEVDLNVTQHANNSVTIIPNKYSQSDSFEIIFFNSEKEIITVHVSSGGGGTRTIYKDKNVIQYVDKEVIKEIEKEVPGETKEVEKVVRKTSWWTWTLLLTLICTIIYIVIRRYKK